MKNVEKKTMDLVDGDKKIKLAFLGYVILNIIVLFVQASYKKRIQYSAYEYSDYFWNGFFNANSSLGFILSIFITIVLIIFTTVMFRKKGSEIFSNSRMKILSFYLIINSVISLIGGMMYFGFLNDLKQVFNYYPQKPPVEQLSFLVMIYFAQIIISLVMVSLLNSRKAVKCEKEIELKINKRIDFIAFSFIIVGFFKFLLYIMYFGELDIITDSALTIWLGIERNLEMLNIAIVVPLFNSLMMILFGIVLKVTKQKEILNSSTELNDLDAVEVLSTELNDLDAVEVLSTELNDSDAVETLSTELNDLEGFADNKEYMLKNGFLTEEQYQKIAEVKKEKTAQKLSPNLPNYVYLKNDGNGLVVDAKIGFSWTTLFFGFFPALFRGDGKWALIQIVASFFTWGFSMLIFPFIYNRLYINHLVSKGYKPLGDTDKEKLVRLGLIVKINNEKQMPNQDNDLEEQHRQKLNLLKEYKELLDNEVITELEFQEKKKQIL